MTARTPEGYVDADAYIQVRPKRGYFSERVEGAGAVRLTQSRSDSPEKGTITVKVTLRIPKRAFDPLQPEAVVVIPADLTDPNPIEVEAQDPTDGDA